ncbi:alpha-N-acetylgalactosaminidase [Rhinatrema bivittatum]|uniref:alpha-N-acetylgalactosaminidase n=1 Tax=Rhinatrema bivittatum TaxID=194408 RepID=UPI00112BE309|nr:alpha-N-acetylgalactosaminidase [Rhinatrema bivittatum]
MLLTWLLVTAHFAHVLALENGLMRVPPMGWMTWERFRCNVDCTNNSKNCISERLILDIADRLVKDGWRELGYNYVNIDDCWMAKERNKEGRLVPDPGRFPSGIKALADYVHSRGLKLGIYADLGNKTCADYPGTTLDKVELDAKTFAEWHVDMLKLDGCYSTSKEQAKGYPRMSKALNATGRLIGYSCSWPAYQGGLPPKVNYSQLKQICNLWRNYDDIEDSWASVLKVIDWFAENQNVLQPMAGPGHWNDPDMLVIGNFGLSFEEAKSQMAFWALLAAPLFMSNDLRTISKEAREILQNRLLIKINQDPLGIQGWRILKEISEIEVHFRPLSNSASALLFFSRRTDMPLHYSTSLRHLNFTGWSVYKAHDVYSRKVVNGLRINTNFTVVVNPSGVVMWYLIPIKPLTL